MANLEAYGDKLIGVIASSGGGGGGGDVANYILTIPTTGYTEQSVEIWGETKTVQVITLTTDKDGIPLSDFTSSMIVDYPINIDGTLTDFAKLYAHEIGNGSVTFYFTSIPSESFNVLVRQAASSEAPVPPGPDTPDGKTVTPTDDIQIWLNCADIWDKTYTTLAEVLADTDTLSALIASSNAVDYMVRSTSWATEQTLIPTMTDNTHPSGVCSASSEASGYPAYRAFDGNDSTDFRVNTASDGWIQYEFPSAVIASNALVNITYAGSTVTGSISGSNNGVDFTTLDSATVETSPYTFNFSNNTTPYKYYRYTFSRTSTGSFPLNTFQIYSHSITASATSMIYIGLNNYAANTLLADETWAEAIGNSTYFESVLNVKVPTMTSNTTPYGECFGSTPINSSYPYWKAFDGDDNTCASLTSTPSSSFVGYKFVSAVKIVAFDFLIKGSGSWTVSPIQISYSDDGVTYTDVSKTFSGTNDVKVHGTFGLYGSHQYWKANRTTSTARQDIAHTVQFYGRKDI